MTDAIKWDQPDQIEAYNTVTGGTFDFEPIAGFWPGVDGLYRALIRGVTRFFKESGMEINGAPLPYAIRNKAPAQPAPSPELDTDAVERLGEALHGLSARLLLSGAMDDDETHMAYEKVVKAFAELEPKPDPLVEACGAVLTSPGALTNEQFAFHLRAELTKRGIELAKTGDPK